MLRPATLILGLVTLSARAHVRLHCDSADCLPVRNARSRDGDGQMSVSGPCGGGMAWGANGFGYVQDGSTVTARINYNGGHRTAANAFTARFLCGSPGQNDFRTATDLAAASCVTSAGCAGSYPCPAPNGNAETGGYTLACTVSVPGLAAGEKRQCSLSVLDQRLWGGCLDFEVESVVPPTPPVGMRDSSGTYLVANSRDAYTDGCGSLCVLTAGQFTVTHNMTGDSMQLTQSIINGSCPGDVEFSEPARAPVSMQRTNGQNTFRANVTIRTQRYEAAVVDGMLSLTNVGQGEPTTCDFAIARGTAVGSSSASESVDKGVAVAFIVIFVILGASAGGFFAYKTKQGYQQADDLEEEEREGCQEHSAVPMKETTAGQPDTATVV